MLGPIVASVGPAGTLGWARIEGQSDTTNVVAAHGSASSRTAGPPRSG